MVELLFEALIGQKTEIRYFHWSKAGQTRTRTEGTGDPCLRYAAYHMLTGSKFCAFFEQL